MRMKKVLATGVVLAATAVLAPAATASAANASVNRTSGFACEGYGEGSTPQEALRNARQDMIGDVTVGPWIYTNGQYADGTYWEVIYADCVLIQ
jgi:hypothetical protein